MSNEPKTREAIATTENVLQAIVDYVRTSNTDYALLINGPWGSGKTYFWKDCVETKLKSVKLDGKPCRPLYVSLYGCKNTKDIDTQLFLQSRVPGLESRRRLSTSVKSVAKALKVFKPLRSLDIDLGCLVNAKNAVLCFDDLERAPLDIKEILGYINTFVEHERVKTIILTSEDAIEDEAKELYKEMKEKVVASSLTFRPNLDNVFSNLIKEHESNAAFHSFVTKNVKLIRYMFERSETHNIRALRRAITALANIHDVIQADQIAPDLIAKQLICATVPTAFAFHGEPTDPDKLREVHKKNSLVIGAMRFTARHAEQTEKPAYEDEFSARYFSEFDLLAYKDAVGCPPICEYVITGYLDKPLLIEWARDLTKTPTESEERIKRLTSDVRNMGNEEFEQTAAQVLLEVEGGEIADVDTYVRLYDSFQWFADENLISMSRQQILDKFIGGLDKAQESGRLKARPDWRLKFDHPALKASTKEGQALRQHVLEVNKKALGQGICERVQVLGSRLQEDARGFISALYDDGESGFLSTPVFQELDANDTTARILALSNALKSHFRLAVQARYEKRALPPEFATELPVLTRIRDMIKKHCDDFEKGTEPIPMSILVTQGIVQALDQAVEQLQQLKQPEEGGKQ